MDDNHTKSVSHLFIQTAKTVRSWAEQELSELDLHVGQNHLLMELYEEDGRRPGELADTMAVDPSVVSKMLRRMESRGLIERRSDPDDARVTRVFLTDEGKDLEEEVENFHQRLEEQIVQSLSSEEKLLFRRMLSDVNESFSETD